MATTDRAEAIREIAEAVGCRVPYVRSVVSGELQEKMRGRVSYELAHRIVIAARAYSEIPDFAALGPVMTEHGQWEPLPDLERNWNLPLKGQLKEILGDEVYLKLLESRGGKRLFVAKDPYSSELSNEIGIEGARRLSAVFGGEYIKVPLDREFRALAYREQKLSNARIALRIGLTEHGAQQLFARLKARERHSEKA